MPPEISEWPSRICAARRGSTSVDQLAEFMAAAEHHAIAARKHVEIEYRIEIGVAYGRLRLMSVIWPLSGVSSGSPNRALAPTPVQLTMSRSPRASSSD